MFRGLISILILLSAAYLTASPASAAIKNSKHDLSALGGEPCAYCHSVHNAAGGMGRAAYMGELPDITEVYNSPTYDHDPNTSLGSVNNSDAPLCITCHDGAVLAGDSVEIQNIKAIIAGSTSDISSDLRNDHPVGFVFDASLDDEIKAPAWDSHVYVSYGPAKNEMWCSTCHNVHDATYTPFLVMSNQQSALCFECHIK